MAVNRCKSCGTLFAIGLETCPHCRSVLWEEDGAMPKISKAEGATQRGARMVGGEWVADGEEGRWLTPDTDTAPEPEAEPEEALTGPEADDGDTGSEDTAGPYDGLTVDQLKEALAERGLPKSGKRDDLVKRLTDADTVEG